MVSQPFFYGGEIVKYFAPDDTAWLKKASRPEFDYFDPGTVFAVSGLSESSSAG